MLFFSAVFQNATQNSLELLDDPKAAAVDEIAAKLGMCKVGFDFPSVLCLTSHCFSCLHTGRTICMHIYTKNRCLYSQTLIQWMDSNSTT